MAAACSAASAFVALPVHAQPAPLDGQWRGSLGLSASLSAGNSESASFSAKLDATRASPDNKWSIYGTSLYGKRRLAEGDEKTADNGRLGTRYDQDLTPTVFGFGLAEAETDRLADLDYRTTLALGVGYHFFRTPENTFDVFTGLAGTRTKYDPDLSTPPSSGSATELLLGEESSHKLNETLSLKQKLTIYPSIDGSGEYRSVFDASLIVGLTSRLSLQVGLQNKFTSDVPEGVKKSDTLLLTGLNVRFGAP
jgi:putative salt-induced outer membrane protein YdiY